MCRFIGTATALLHPRTGDLWVTDSPIVDDPRLPFGGRSRPLDAQCLPRGVSGRTVVYREQPPKCAVAVQDHTGRIDLAGLESPRERACVDLDDFDRSILSPAWVERSVQPAAG